MKKYIDRIVEGFHSGDRKLREEAADLYEDTYSIKQIQSDAVCLGLVVPHVLFEFDPDRLDQFVESFTAGRISELQTGSTPTVGELRLYRQCVLEEAEGGDCDADLTPGFWIHRLLRTDGREVYALTTVTNLCPAAEIKGSQPDFGRDNRTAKIITGQ